MSQINSGSVYVASMNMRGKWAKSPAGAIRINVTSAQPKKNRNRLDFSPMTPVENGYKGYFNFESYWQSGKVFEGIPSDDVKSWWKNLKKPKRRYPKAKSHKVLHAQWDSGPQLNYIASRKSVYVPEYYNLIKDRKMTQNWKQKLVEGCDLVIYDFDGPREANKDLVCLKLTKELLIKKINDKTYPFGHGYIVASCIAGIHYSEYI